MFLKLKAAGLIGKIGKENVLVKIDDINSQNEGF